MTAVTADEFRSDVLALLRAVDEWARRLGLPPHLAPGTDVLRMARTVRLLGRVRRPQDRHGPGPRSRWRSWRRIQGQQSARSLSRFRYGLTC